MKANFTSADRQAIVETAQRLGVDPGDLTAVMAYESGLGPDRQGGAGNAYKGLIQFGQTERKQYGYRPGMTIAEQVQGPVYNYLKDRGLKPGMGIAHLYSIINAGSLTRDGQPRWNAKDQNGSVREHVQRITKQYFGPGKPVGGPTPPLNVGQTAQGRQMPLGMGRGQIKSGPAVRQLQQQLTDAGFNPGPVDGKYGRQTAAAVRQVEKQYNLPTRDRGVAGPQVQSALAGIGNAPAQTRIPLPAMRPTGGAAGGVPSTFPARPEYPFSNGAGQTPPAPRGDMTARPIDPSLVSPGLLAGQVPHYSGGAPASSGPVGSAFKQTAMAPPDPYTQAKIDATPQEVVPGAPPVVTSEFPARPSFPASNATPLSAAGGGYPYPTGTGRSYGTDERGISELMLGRARTSPDAFVKNAWPETRSVAGGPPASAPPSWDAVNSDPVAAGRVGLNDLRGVLSGMQRFGEASPNAPQTPAAAGGFFPQAEIDRARQASVLPALNAPANAMDAGNWLVRNFGSGSGGPPQVARQPAAPSISPAVPNTSYQGYIPGGFDYMRQDPMTMGSSGSTDTLVGGAGAGADRLSSAGGRLVPTSVIHGPASGDFNLGNGGPASGGFAPVGDPANPGVVPAGDPPPGAAGASAGDLERGNPYFAGGRGPMARAPIGTQYVGAPKPKVTFADRAVPALAGMTPGIGLILAPILRSAMRTGSFDNAQSYRGPIQGRNYAPAAPNPYGGYTTGSSYSASPFTPAGYTAPNFNPTSGGALYSYQPNGQGGGSYVDSAGRVHQY